MVMRIRLWTIFLLAICLQGSCLKEETDKYKADTPAIQLQSEGTSINTSLSWTKVNTSNFKEYIIVSSINPIPIYTKVSEIKATDIIARIKDPAENKLQNFNIFSKSNMRVFVDIGVVLLYSNTVELASNIFQLSNSNSIRQIAIDQKNGILFTLNNTANLERLDLKALTSTHIIPISGISISDDITMEIAYPNNVAELYIPVGTKIHVYNTDNLNLITTIPNVTASTIYNVAADEKGFLYFTDASGQASISRVDLMTHQMTRFGDLSTSTYRMLKVSKDGTKFFTGNRNVNSAIKYYEIDASTNVLSKFTFSTGQVDWSTSFSVEISHTGSYLITKSPASIYDKSFNKVGILTTSSSEIYKSVKISSDNKYISLMDTRNSEIVYFENFPPFKFAKKYKYKSTSPTTHFLYNDQPFVIGFLVNNQSGAFVQVIEKAFEI